MMKSKLQVNSIFIIGCLIILLLLNLLHFTSIKAEEVDDTREFNYVKGSHLGPEKWGELHPEWAACKCGNMQSPIDIFSPRVEIIPPSKGLQRNYKPQNASVNNKGHYIMVQWEGDAGSVLINGRDFGLQQAHWHTPSEHTINGRRYEMELHMVHRSTDHKTTAVIALVYEFGYPDPFLSQLGPSISPLIGKTDEERQVGEINPMKIKVSDKWYYNYIGSLTTPPCTEGVIWIVSKKISTVSRDQVKLLHEAVNDNTAYNARPLQPLNQRKIHLYYQKGRKD